MDLLLSLKTDENLSTATGIEPFKVLNTIVLCPRKLQDLNITMKK